MYTQIQITDKGISYMFQSIGFNLGAKFFRMIINSDGTPKPCTFHTNDLLTYEMKGRVEVKVGDYVLDKKRDTKTNNNILEIHKIVGIDDSVVPVAELKYIKTIPIKDLQNFLEELKPKKIIRNIY